MLYTGIARDVDARFQAHLKGAGAKFTRLHPPVRVLARLALESRSDALRAEYALKQLTRAEKLELCSAGLEAFAHRIIHA